MKSKKNVEHCLVCIISYTRLWESHAHAFGMRVRCRRDGERYSFERRRSRKGVSPPTAKPRTCFSRVAYHKGTSWSRLCSPEHGCPLLRMHLRLFEGFLLSRFSMIPSSWLSVFFFFAPPLLCASSRRGVSLCLWTERLRCSRRSPSPFSEP